MTYAKISVTFSSCLEYDNKLVFEVKLEPKKLTELCHTIANLQRLIIEMDGKKKEEVSKP